MIKSITTKEFNNLTKENFTERLKQASLTSKKDMTDFIKKKEFNGKLRKINHKVT